MSSLPTIDINDYQQLFFENRKEETKEFDFSQVWENIDNSSMDPLSALMGDVPTASNTPLITESPMMNTPYLDSCINTPFTPATVFTPNLNQFQSFPYYPSYIDTSYNQGGVAPEDIQLVNYLPDSSKENFTSQEQAISTDDLFGSGKYNSFESQDNETDSLFPPNPSDLFVFDETLFNMIDPVADVPAPTDDAPPVVAPLAAIPSATKKRKTDEKDKPNKRIKMDAKQKHPCPVCSATFDRRYNLGTHIKTHDKNRKKDFGCHLCTKTFDRKHDLTRHVSTVHNGERAYTCDSCSSTFSRKDAMVRHRVQKHGCQL